MARTILLSAAWLTFVCVEPAGAATLRVPADYPTINEALDATAPGDTVLVAPGVYDQWDTRLHPYGFHVSSVAFLPDGVTLKSEGGPSSTTLRMDTTLAFPYVMISWGEGVEAEIEGFTLTGSLSGLHCLRYEMDGRCVIRDCVFGSFGTGHTSEGAIEAIEVDLEVHTSRFEDIAGSSGIAASSSNVLIEDCEFSNIARALLAVGGDNPHPRSLVIRRSRFVDCYDESAIYAAAQPSVVIEDCWIEGNSGPHGGGVRGAVTSSFEMRRCTLVANHATGGGKGGGLRLIAVWNALVENNTFFGNIQDLDWSDGGAAIHVRDSACTIQNNVIAASIGEQAVGVSNVALTTGCNVYWANALGNTSGFGMDPTDLDADPQFCGAESSDFTVMETSPCLPENNDHCTELIGAWGEGCGAVSIEPETWGRLKAHFRSDDRE